MPVIARDAFAAGHLVYAWPFPIGPECEVSCRDDEQVVMCPAWTIGDRLGPGRHLWRTPDPTRPVHAYFVSHGSVDVEFELITRFQLPGNAQPIQIRAGGSVLIRCGDPGVLIAQFIGLPFDSIDDGIRRSVARSVERMVARLLTRRVVMAGTIDAIVDPTMLQPIIEEIVSYNPTAGAVFGVELSQLSRLQIEANDGQFTKVSPPLSPPQPRYGEGSNGDGYDSHHHHGVNGWETALPPPIPEEVARHDTMRGMAAGSNGNSANSSVSGQMNSVSASGVVSGETSGTASGVVSGMTSGTPAAAPPASSASSSSGTPGAQNPGAAVSSSSAGPGAGGSSGVISGMTSGTASGMTSGTPPSATSGAGNGVSSSGLSSATASGVISGETSGGVASGSISPKPPLQGAAPPPPPPPRRASVETLPPPLPSIPPRPVAGAGGPGSPGYVPPLGSPGHVATLGTLPPDVSAEGSTPRAARLASEPDARSSIMAIGARIGDRQVTSGEILAKVEPGKRVLVPGPHGLMQSATVRQLLSGYYELEVGASGETIWVPMAHVVPE